MTARNFLSLYSLVSTICQDVSTAGKAQAKVGINSIIKDITREFKLPDMFKGQDNSVFVLPSVSRGPQTLKLPSDVRSLENVWWVDNTDTIYQIDEIDSDEDWLSSIDMYSDGDPEVYRDFVKNSSGDNQIQIWPSPNDGWVSKSGGKLYLSYWAQLVQLSADADIPNIPYELDPILVNGGVVEMARMQGDTALLNVYLAKYEDDKAEMRAWIVRQHEKDVTMTPDSPMGMFGRSRGRGYKISG